MLDRTVLTRSSFAPLPVDSDSRLELLRVDNSPAVPFAPVWPKPVAAVLEEIIEERHLEQRLLEAGIEPTKSVLFCGPPGTGKTLAATWLAEQLHIPCLTLDLSAVMSSFLGRTGNNIRTVLDYSRRLPGVLLLDEFDALAKRRDDALEIGELKRLVTVLLQEIERWPAHGILIAATNHPDLLDPAVWRRFDRVLEFPLPSPSELEELFRRLIPETDRALDFARAPGSIVPGFFIFGRDTRYRGGRENGIGSRCRLRGIDLPIRPQTCASLNPWMWKLAVARLLLDTGMSPTKSRGTDQTGAGYDSESVQEVQRKRRQTKE